MSTSAKLDRQVDLHIEGNRASAMALVEAGWWYPDEPTHARIFNAALPESCRLHHEYPFKVYLWRSHWWFRSPIERMPDMATLHRIVISLSIRRRTSMTRAGIWVFDPENEPEVVGLYAIEALR